MKQLLSFSTLVVFALASAQTGNPSGVAGRGVIKTEDGSRVEGHLELVNRTRDGKTAVFGNGHFLTGSKESKRMVELAVSPRRNGEPVRGTLTIAGKVATAEVAAVLIIRENRTSKRVPGKAVITVTDNGRSGDTAQIAFSAEGGQSWTVAGTVERGDFRVRSVTP
jgi:hypothetical protein